MRESRVLTACRDGTTAQLPGLLTENVVFSSPVRDYLGLRLAASFLQRFSLAVGTNLQTGALPFTPETDTP